MPFCSKCGSEIGQEERFCSNCGQLASGGESSKKDKTPKKRSAMNRTKKIIIGLIFIFLVFGGVAIFAVLFGDEDIAADITVISYTYFRPTNPENNIKDPDTGYEMVSGEVIVIAEDGTMREKIEEVINKVGGNILGYFEEVGLYQIEIQGDDSASIRMAAEVLKNMPEVRAAFPNYVMMALDTETAFPDDPQWTGKNPKRRWGQEYIKLPQAWTITTGSSSLKVGVFDTGFDPRHPDLKHLKIRLGDLYWYTKISDKMGLSSSLLDHGNGAAGIIGAMANNKKGMAGVMWDVELYGYISNALTDFIDLINAADQDGVRVVNISLGGDWANKGEANLEELEEWNAILIETLNPLVNKILFVVGAGNNPDVPVEHMHLASLSFLDNVLTVGAINSTGDRATFSTYGDGVSVAAPGTGIWSATATDNYFRIISLQRWLYKGYTGTSFSAPFVTGVAGLILSVNPDLSPVQVKNIIINTADPHDFDQPLGSGVVNAIRALEEARRLKEESSEETEEIEPAPEQASVNYYLAAVDEGKVLNIRKTPGTKNKPNDDILERAYRGQVLIVINKHDNNIIRDDYTWWEIRCSGEQTGWVAQELLLPTGWTLAPFLLDQSDFSYTVNNKKISFGLSKKQVDALLGPPEKVAFDDPDWFYEDCIVATYSTMQLLFIPPYGREGKHDEYMVVKIYTDSSLVYGPRNIQVGDSLDSVIQRFPNEKKPITSSSGEGPDRPYKKTLYDSGEILNDDYFVGMVNGYIIYDKDKNPVELKFGFTGDKILILEISNGKVSGMLLTEGTW